jgi:hypothetical protein
MYGWMVVCGAAGVMVACVLLILGAASTGRLAPFAQQLPVALLVAAWVPWLAVELFALAVVDMLKVLLGAAVEGSLQRRPRTESAAA